MAEVEEMDTHVNETLDESYLFSQDEADQSYSSMISNVGYVTTECDGCKSVKMVIVKCQECNKCMCAECKILHKQVVQNRSHTVDSVEEVIRKVQIDLEEISPQLDKREETLKLKLYGETRFIDDLKHMERKVINAINLHREDLRTKIDSHHDDLINKVHEINDKTVLSSNERKDTINHSITEIAGCMKLIQDLTTGMEFSYLLQEGRAAQENTIAKIKAIDGRINGLKEGTLPCMTVVGPKPWVGDSDGTTLQTEILQSKEESLQVQERQRADNDKQEDDVVKKTGNSKVRRHQSLDSASANLIPTAFQRDAQVSSRLQRFESLDSLSSKRLPVRTEIETTKIRNGVSIQNIIQKLQKCAEPKKHDTSPRDLPRRSQSFTTSNRSALRENLRLNESPVVSRSELPKRSQSFTSASTNRWNYHSHETVNTKYNTQTPSLKNAGFEDKPKHEDNSGKQPLEEAGNTKQPVYTPKYSPSLETQAAKMEPKKEEDYFRTESTSLSTVTKPIDTRSTTCRDDQVKKSEVMDSRLPKRSQAFTQKSTTDIVKDEGRLDVRRRLSDPHGLGSTTFSKSSESGINTWGSTTSISETSMKSYSSVGDLSDTDRYLTPRSGLPEPLDLSKLNETEMPGDEEDRNNKDCLVNGTSTPIPNTHLAFPQLKESYVADEEQTNGTKDTTKLPGSKKISSDQIRNMVSSMVSPRRTGGIPPPPGLKSLSLISPRRLNTGYQTGSRKSPLGTPRSYSTGVIHTITETDQDVDNSNVFEADDSGRHKPINRSLSCNTTLGHEPGNDQQQEYETAGEAKTNIAEDTNDTSDNKVKATVKDTDAEHKSQPEMHSPPNPGKPKGILKQRKELNDRESESVYPVYREVRTDTEEVIEKPRHTIHSPRMTQQSGKKYNGFTANNISPEETKVSNQNMDNSKPKKLSLNISFNSDTENDDTSTETIKNSPRFMDIFHQLNGAPLSESLPTDLKSPRRVHVLKSHVKFVEEEKQKMKVRKNNDRKLLNGTSTNRVSGQKLANTLPAKLPSHHNNASVMSKFNTKTESKTNSPISTNGVAHISSESSCEADFTKMEDMSYIIEGLSQLPFRPYRLYMIDNTLWCSALSGLHIYDVNCKFVRSIKHPELRHCRAIVKTAPNEIIVGCADKYGLVALDLNGEFNNQIMGGCFPNVNFFKQQLFALECNRNEILVFGMEKKGWQGIRVISLNYSYNSSLHDIMHIHHDGTMYLSCWNENCILYFNAEGNLVTSFGQYGQGEAAGRLYDPRLCKLDVHGNAIIADYWNQRMQICTRGGEWSLLEIAGDLGLALDAVVDNELNTIWVIARDNKLMKFVAVD